MMFGNPDTFAIEIGEIVDGPEARKARVQFRFAIDGQRLGDWLDRISLVGSAGYMEEFLDCSVHRRVEALRFATPEVLFASIYDAFYQEDCKTLPNTIPNLQTRFHINDIGLGAIEDLYGIVVVDVSDATSRIVVEDLRREKIIIDIDVPLGTVEAAGRAYVQWTRQRIGDTSGQPLSWKRRE